MRRLLIVLGSLVGGVVLILAAAFAYAQTSLGRDQIGGVIERSLTQPGRTAEVQGLAGLLPFDVRLGRVRLADDEGVWLEVDGIRAQVSPTDLLTGRVLFRELGAERVRLERLPASVPPTAAAETDEPFSLPRLPDSLPVFAADRIYVSTIELGAAVAGEEARFSLDGSARTTPAGRQLDTDLTLVRTDEDTARATLNAELDLAGETVDLALEAVESGGLLAGLTGRPEAGDLDLRVNLAGPFDNVAGKIVGDATNLARLEADLGLSIGQRPAVDLTGTLTVSDGALPAKVAPLVGERLNLRVRGGQRDASRLALEELGVSSAAFTLSGQGEADLQARDLSGSIRLDMADLARASAIAGVPLGGALSLSGTAAGTLDQPELKVELNGQQLAADAFAAERLTTDLSVTLLGPLDRDYQGVRISGEGGAQGVTLDGQPLPAAPDPSWRVTAELPASGVASVEELALQAEALTATLSGQLDQATMTGQGQLRVDAPDLAAIIASLGPLAPPGLELKGAVNLTADASKRDASEVMDVSLTLAASGLQGLPAGAQELVGAEPRLTAEATVTPTERVEVKSLSLAAAGMSATGSGAVGLADQALAAQLEAQIPSLAPLSEIAGQRLAGKATVAATLAGTTAAPTVELTSTVDDLAAAGVTVRQVRLTADAAGALDQLTGKLRLVATQPQGEVTLSSGYARDGQTVRLDTLSLTGPATEISGDAAVDLDSLLTTAKLKGSITDLAALRPWHSQNLSGRVELDAALSTPDNRQDATLRASAHGVAGDFGELRTANVDARVQDALGAARVDATFAAEGFAGSGVTVETASLSAGGALADLRVEVKATGAQQGPFDLSARSRMQLEGERKRVELQALDGLYAGQTIELRAPATLTLEQGTLDIDQLDLRIGQARIQGDAETGAGRVRGRASVTGLPLSMLAALGGPALTGTLQAELELAGPLATPRADLSLTVTALAPAARAAVNVPPADLTLTARVDDGRLAATARVEEVTEQPVTASLTAPFRLSLDPVVIDLPPEGRLDGRLDADAQLDRLAALAALDGQRLEGALSAHLELAGTVADPLVSGELTAGPASVEDALTGIHYRDVYLRLVGAGQSIVLDELRATSRGDGTLRGTGRLDLDSPDGLAYTVETQLSGAELLRSDLGNVIMSGNVELSGTAAAALVSGRLEVQRADLMIPGSGGPDIPTLDVVEIGGGIEPGAGPAPQAAAPFETRLDVAVDVPARLFIRGRGLDSEWGGALTVKGLASEPQVLGQITFRRGFLDFLDRRFRIREGLISFTGAQPPMPEVLLEAASQGQQIVALVKVSGPADDFALELTSEPPLPRDEVLARLLFDRSTSSMTPAQGLRLANAVATLEGRGFDAVGRLRRGLGLDTLDVGGESVDDANVRAGKYLADGVYFEVQQGVQAGSSKARIEVELTPRLSVTSEVNEQSQSSVGLDWKLDY